MNEWHKFSDKISALDIETLLKEIEASINYGEGCKTLSCLNPHSYIQAQNDNKFHDAVLSSDWVIADGIGIALAARFLEFKKIPRITGPDLHVELMRRLDNSCASVFYLGSDVETLKKIKIRVLNDFPNINFVGYFSPPYKEVFDHNECCEMTTAINRKKVDVLWVGMTAPKQEKWIYDNKQNLNVAFVGAIGAAFDFYAGTVPRAPYSMRKMGMEWLYRSIQSPDRLGKRNLVSNPKFVWRVLVEKISTWLK